MRALTATGKASEPVVLTEQVDEPEAGANQVVIAVEAFSINRGETFLLRNPKPGWRPGKDVAGRVVAAAANGAGPAVGERVVAHAEHSGWAERVAVDVDSVATLPESVPTTTAAALPLAGLTALRLLRVAGSVAGRRILLTGASGGVGHYLVELVAHQGGEVTAVTSSAERGARLLELGAADVVSDIASAAGDFDVVMESIGGEVLASALRRLRPGGLAIWFGQASEQPPTLDFFDWSVPLDITIRRFGYQPSDRSDGADLATLVGIVDRGDLHPEIGLTRPWTDTSDAIAALLNREIRGNAVLLIAN